MGVGNEGGGGGDQGSYASVREPEPAPGRVSGGEAAGQRIRSAASREALCATPCPPGRRAALPILEQARMQARIASICVGPMRRRRVQVLKHRARACHAVVLALQLRVCVA
eukprot:scaffold25579_cov124-Isochrysis_galbana.AAC.2